MKIHIVKKGDTLFDLSKKYNVPLQKLIEANPQISNPDQLSIGMKVKIPTSAVPVDEGIIYKHTVKQGDSLWKLAKAWGLPLQTLVNANPQLSDPNVLQVGEVINIPGAASPGAHHSPDNTGANPAAPIGPAGKKNTAPKPENIKPENIKTENIKPENIKVENIKTENIKAVPVQPKPVENIKPEIKPENIKPENIKLESIKVENIKIVENVMPILPQQLPQMEVKPIKYEEHPCPPKPHCPELVSPYQFKVEPPMLMAEQAMPYPPCGCSDHSAKPENLVHPYQTENQMISSYYDIPPTWHSENVMGEYPGLSNAPMYQQPQYVNPYSHADHYAPYSHYGHHENIAPFAGGDNKPWGETMPFSNIAPLHTVNAAPLHMDHVAPHTTNVAPLHTANVAPMHTANVSPMHTANIAPLHMANYPLENVSLQPASIQPNAPHPSYYEPMHGYSPCGCSGNAGPVHPYANAPYLPYYGGHPNVPMAPLGAFGAPDHMHEECYKGGKRQEENQAEIQSTGKAPDTVQAADQQLSAEREAKISEHKKSKQQSSNSASKGNKPSAKKKHRSRRNPWINN